MDSIWVVSFVVAMTFVTKWLLFDDDAPAKEHDEPPRLRLITHHDERTDPPRSKSA